MGMFKRDNNVTEEQGVLELACIQLKLRIILKSYNVY